MKNIITVILIAIMFLSSCGTINRTETILVYSKHSYFIEHSTYTEAWDIVIPSIHIEPKINHRDSVYYTRSEHYQHTHKKDKRPYTFHVCKVDKNTQDTIKVFVEIGNDAEYKINGYSSFNLYEYNQAVHYKDTSKNYPSPNEFMQYLKSIQSPDYFEILPGQECLTINRPMEQ